MIPIDKFARIIGYERIAIETFKNMDKQDQEILESYCNGVNDFVSNINIVKESASAKLLPLEFYAVGLNEFEPWTPKDSLSILKVLNFHLTWNWG